MKVSTKIEEAVVQYNKGMYDLAIEHYEEAAKYIARDISTYKHFKKDLIEKEAGIYNSIAACYK